MRRRLSIVYPSLGNAFYFQLAKRLRDAVSELGVEANLIGSSNLDCLGGSWATSVPAFIVSPKECFLSGSDMMDNLANAPFRAAVLADCVGTRWYRNTLTLDMEFDLVLDVGFLNQGSLQSSQAVPYRLLFNAPLPAEIESIARANEALAVSKLGTDWTPDPRAGRTCGTSLLCTGYGVPVLATPSSRPAFGRHAQPTALHCVLQATNIYVWRSHHSLPYYESFRFLTL